MSKNKKRPYAKYFKNSDYLVDPHFRRIYNKITKLVKEGKSKEEILKIKLFYRLSQE